MTIFSKLNIDYDEVHKQIKQQEKIWPPAIPYAGLNMSRDKKSKDSADKSSKDEDKSNYRTFEIPLDRDDEDSDTFDLKLKVFRKGKPEEWVKWRKDVQELFEMLGHDTASDQLNYYQALLADEAREEFNRAHGERTATNRNAPTEEALSQEEILQLVINDVAKKYFPQWETAVRYQKHYMRTSLFIGDKDPDKFFDRVREMNDSIKYFPYDERRRSQPYDKLDEEEIIDLANGAKKLEWHIQMMSQGKNPVSFETIEECKTHFKQLYEADRMIKTINGTDKESKKGRKRKNSTDKPKKKKPCKHCGKFHKESDDKCWTLPENKNKRPRNFKNDPSKKKKFYSQEETANMMTMIFKNLKKNDDTQKKNIKKRKVSSDENSDDEHMNMFNKLRVRDSDNDSSSDSDSSETN